MVHEAFCLDSQGAYLWGKDDFIGASLDARWSTSGDAGGSAAVVDAQDGGIIRLTTGGTTDDDWLLNWGDIRSLHVNKKVTIESRFKISSITSSRFFFMLKYDGNNTIYFWSSNAAILINCTNGGAITQNNLGNILDTNYHIYKIECFPTGEVHFYIDGVETADSPITTNIPSDAADYLQPNFQITTKENTAKSMDIDYVQWRQDI